MKFSILLTIIVFNLNWLIAQQDYPVRGIDTASAKFTRIFEAAKQTERPFRVVISQHLSGSSYLARNGTELFRVDMLSDKLYTDDQEVNVLLADTGEVFQYTTILGAKKTIPHYKEVPGLTPSRFIEKLKGGASYTVVMPLPPERCSACGGFGGSSLNNTTCSRCGGSGKLNKSVKLKIVW